VPLVHFVTHPEVVIDPAVPVTEWRLAPRGLERMRLAAAQPWAQGLTAVWSSAERKAAEAGAILAAARGLACRPLAALGENDRSATGYLPPPEFEATADRFFAEPGTSVRGWERASDAQRRIVAAVGDALAAGPGEGDVAIVAHGAVGALLLCHLEGVAISRSRDQPATGGGNRFAFEAATRRLVQGWMRIEA